MKKGKLNCNGFVLVETLIVSVFIMGIFAVLYNNFFPLIGEYEKREVYDDIDGKYATYWIKRVIEHHSVTFKDAAPTPHEFSDPDNSYQEELNNNGYFKFNCNMVGTPSMKSMCEEIVDKTQIMIDDANTPSDPSDDFPHIYVTRYHLGDKGSVKGFKTLINEVHNSAVFTGGMHKYLVYLPDYSKIDSLNNAKYRVIVEFHRTKDENNYVAYSTFEVRK